MTHSKAKAFNIPRRLPRWMHSYQLGLDKESVLRELALHLAISSHKFEENLTKGIYNDDCI